MVPTVGRYLVRPGGAPAQVADNEWLVVASQTCDVVASKLEAEPLVEVLHCKPIPKLRSGMKELRSTRILDFKPNRKTHGDLCLSAHAIADRYELPRELLRDHDPDPDRRLSEVATKRVAGWYALRYGRPSWPDAFVDRISGARDELEAALEPLKDDVAEVRVGIVEKLEELPEGDTYHVALFFVVDEDVWEKGVDARAAIYSSFNKFIALLKGCKGIEVDIEGSQVVSGAEFSWQETRATDEWNFANLSHRE